MASQNSTAHRKTTQTKMAPTSFNFEKGLGLLAVLMVCSTQAQTQTTAQTTVTATSIAPTLSPGNIACDWGRPAACALRLHYIPRGFLPHRTCTGTLQL